MVDMYKKCLKSYRIGADWLPLDLGMPVLKSAALGIIRIIYVNVLDLQYTAASLATSWHFSPIHNQEWVSLPLKTTACVRVHQLCHSTAQSWQLWAGVNNCTLAIITRLTVRAEFIMVVCTYILFTFVCVCLISPINCVLFSAVQIILCCWSLIFWCFFCCVISVLWLWRFHGSCGISAISI